MVREWRQGACLITTDKAGLDLETIHGFLKTSYWAAGIPAQAARRSVGKLPRFRLVSGRRAGRLRPGGDGLRHVRLPRRCRRPGAAPRGLGKWMMEVVFSHPEPQGLRRWMLATRDAHGLYSKYGFAEPEDPRIFMEKYSAYE